MNYNKSISAVSIQLETGITHFFFALFFLCNFFPFNFDYNLSWRKLKEWDSVAKKPETFPSSGRPAEICKYFSRPDGSQLQCTHQTKHTTLSFSKFTSGSVLEARVHVWGGGRPLRTTEPGCRENRCNMSDDKRGIYMHCTIPGLQTFYWSIETIGEGVGGEQRVNSRLVLLNYLRCAICISLFFWIR